MLSLCILLVISLLLVEPASALETHAATKPQASQNRQQAPLARSLSETKPDAIKHPKGAVTPNLGNTPVGDRVLLREVSDNFIFDDAIKATKPQSDNVSRPNSGTAPLELPNSVWEYVQQSTRLQLTDHEKISYYREQYRLEAPWISLILRRATPFIGYVVETLDRQYLPVELALLPAIESGYRPDVQSPKNAVGIWQIIPATAKDIGLTSTPWFDGRSDIREATVAAIDYLSYLNAEFHGDWLLTLAAYNGGLGRVRNAIVRNQNAGLPIDFWSLKLPRETREYVPKFLALIAMLRHDRPKGLEIPDITRGSAFDIVDVRQRASVDNIATISGISLRVLEQLNSGLVHGVTPPQGPHHIYVPQGMGTPLINLLVTQSSLELYTPAETHIVVAGDNLSSIARRYKISQKRLRQMNSLESDLIKIGQQLSVLDMHGASPQFEYVVTIGDTLSEIAQRFSVNVANVRDAQGRTLQSDVIHPGERLSLLTNAQTALADQAPRGQ